MTDEERQKIIEIIDFEEQWLKYVKMKKGSIESITYIEIAMNGIRSVIAELEGE